MKGDDQRLHSHVFDCKQNGPVDYCAREIDALLDCYQIGIFKFI